MATGSLEARRPKLALPFTTLSAPDTVRLVAGEDFRYTLTAPGLDCWLPTFLASLDGRLTVREALAVIAPDRRPGAVRIVERLYGERILVDGSAADAHAPSGYRIASEGTGALMEGLATSGSVLPAITILCQDRLDYAEALQFNRRCLSGGGPWMWATVGPLARGYVSPVFMPESGPCLGCLLGHFRRRSPAPEIYDALQNQARKGGAILAVPFPSDGVEILRRLIRGKVSMLQEQAVPVAAYRLHVLEVATFEVSTHPVFRDPECGECGGRRR